MKFFKAIVLGLVSFFSLASCNEPQKSHVADWTQGGNQNAEITISTSDVSITNQSIKVVAGNGVKYYFVVEATCSYQNAEIYGSFSLMNDSNRVLEELKDIKATYSSSNNVYTFKAEIKEDTNNHFRKYSASFSGKAYSNTIEIEGTLVDDETIWAKSVTVTKNKILVQIETLYNLTYLSYTMSLYFNTSVKPRVYDGEITKEISSIDGTTIEIEDNINFSYEDYSYVFYSKSAKTKDKIDKNKVLESKSYNYLYLDFDGGLFASKTLKRNAVSIITGLDQEIKQYPYLTFTGYSTEKNSVTPMLDICPKAIKNLVFYPTVDINYTKLASAAKTKSNTQYSSLKVVLEYYDTVLGVIKYTAAESHGSGIVFGGDRSSRNEFYYALTNYHVVDAMAEKNYSGHQGIKGTVIDYDEEKFEFSVYATDKEHDLAIIRFKANKTIHLVDFDFTDADDVFRLPCVVAIGCPGSSFLKVTTGDYQGTVSVKNSYGYVQTCITHTADGDHGSSGGPVFNWRLRLIGITLGISNNKIIAVSLDDIKNFVSKYDILM